MTKLVTEKEPSVEILREDNSELIRKVRNVTDGYGLTVKEIYAFYYASGKIDVQILLVDGVFWSRHIEEINEISESLTFRFEDVTYDIEEQAVNVTLTTKE